MDIYVKTESGLTRNRHRISKTLTLTLNQRGQGKIQSKKDIEDLMASEQYQKGIVKIDTDRTPLEIVERYLAGELPDKLTTEVLEQLPDEAVLKIAPLVKTVDRKHPSMIRKELRNKPVTNDIQFILDDYADYGEEDGDALERALESGEIIRNGAWYKDKAEEELSTQKRAEALQYAIDKDF